MTYRRIKAYAIQITWDNGDTELRTDFPSIRWLENWLDEVEKEENEQNTEEDEE
jgi:hypothetical protein